MALTTQISLGVSALYTASGDLGTPNVPIQLAESQSWVSGVLAGQADTIFADTRTLTSGSTDNFDLAGAFFDPFGAGGNVSKVKAIIVRSAASNTTTLSIGPAASAPFVGPFSGTTPLVVIPAGGSFAIFGPGTGWTVTATTGDTLRVVNSAGASATYDIIIIGTSA